MRKSLLLAGTLLLIVNPALAQPAAEATARDVEFELREAGQVIAASNVRLQLGRQAAIAVAGPYSVRLRIDAAGEAYTVRPHLSTGGPDGWTRLPTPPMTVAAGARGQARIERVAGPPLEIHVSVR